MFTIMILMCAAGMDPWECQPPTAIERHVVEEKVGNEIMCAMHGEAYAAQLPSAGDDKVFAKVICLREGKS